MNIPGWVHTISIIALILAGISALIIVFDILRGNRQNMWIMNIIWPLTALYAGPLAVWSDFKVGRLSTHQAMEQAKARGEEPESRKKPFWQSATLGMTHCGGGCTLGDLLAEWFIVLVPFTLFGKTVFAAGDRFYAGVLVRYRLSIFHDQTPERIIWSRREFESRKSGQFFTHGLAGGHVRMDGSRHCCAD